MITEVLQFMQARGSGEATLRDFLAYAAIYGETIAESACESPQCLEKELRVKAHIAENIVESRPKAAQIASELEENDVSLIWIGSPHYPRRLVKILQKDAPSVLFVKGNRSLLNAPGVGFCGSRKVSEKGLLITSRCASQLASEKISIVSGYAHGVDMAAHRAALAVGGSTIFVLAEGILRFRRKRDIADFLSIENCLVVSQFPPGLTWTGRNAMKRNATIIGLSDAMILVESGLSGGTYSAGEETLKRRRPLFVIDYAEPGPSAQANPYFIQKGGLPVRGNREGLPVLDRVRDAVSKRSWDIHCSEDKNLLNWNG